MRQKWLGAVVSAEDVVAFLKATALSVHTLLFALAPTPQNSEVRMSFYYTVYV